MADDRLDSWKEIAAYLRRDVTTVRRWEKKEGLPVHRHSHERRDSVYAFPSEIDEWWQSRRNRLTRNGGTDNNGVAETDVDRAALTPSRRAAVRLAAAIGLTAVLAVAVLLIARPRTTDEALGDELRFEMFAPQDTHFDTACLSPDGRHVAFTTTTRSGDRNKGLLWVRALSDTTPRALPDTEGARFPFWSPAGDALGFFAGGKVWTISVTGGSPRSIAEAPDGHGGTWNREGTIVFAPRPDRPLYRVPSSGGEATPVTALTADHERGHLWPEFLPDGNRFLYLADVHHTDAEQHHVYVGALDGVAPTHVFSIASNVAFSRDGYLFYVKDRWLFAQPFDVRRLTFTGQPIAVVDRVRQHVDANHKAEFSLGAGNRLTYRAMQSPANRLLAYDRTGQASPLTATAAEHQEPAISPDGERLAIALFDPQPSTRFGYGVGHVRSNIVLIDGSTGAMSELTTDPGADWGPVWSPDGRQIVFSSNRRTKDLELFVKNLADSRSAEVPLPSTGTYPVAQSWSPDGRFVVYSAFNPKTRTDLWRLPMSGDRTPMPLLQSEFNEHQAQISPDGRWFAYTSNESGRPEVYVRSFPDAGPAKRVSIGSGGDPRWRRDGKELFYLTEDGQLMAVAIKSSTSFAHGAPVALFAAGVRPHWYYARNVYDVGPDGRFVFMRPIEDDAAAPLTIVLNWAAGFRQ